MELQINSLDTRIEKMQERFNKDLEEIKKSQYIMNNAKSVFLKYDQQAMIDKLQLKFDEDYIYLEFVKKKYRIEKTTGLLEWSTDDFTTKEEAGFEEVLSIYDLLCYGNEKPKSSGSWAPINSVKYTPRAIGVETNFSGAYAKYFDENVEAFQLACGKLGGEKVPVGDIGYEIPVFGEIKVRLKFYLSDEEFPAQLVMLWDREILKYMHYETTYYVMNHVYKRLKEVGY